jgi:hypothetical protein
MQRDCTGMHGAADPACLTLVRRAYRTNPARPTGLVRGATRHGAIPGATTGPRVGYHRWTGRSARHSRLEPMNVTTQRRSGAATRGR